MNWILAATEAATEGSTEVAEASEGIGALGLDLFPLLAGAATFLLLFWVVKNFALDGVVKNLQKRETDINRGLHLTAELDKEKADLDEKVEKVLKSARKDADVILVEARAESGRIVAAAEEKASNRVDDILRAAEGKIERDIVDAREGLKGELAGLVTEATEAVLNQKLDSQSDRELVEDYLKEAMQ